MHRRLLVVTALSLAACGDPRSPSMTLPATDAGTMPTADGGTMPPEDDASVPPLDPDAGPPVPTFTLTLDTTGFWGTGALEVAGHGAPCEGTCELQIPEGEVITIVAAPGFGQSLSEWASDCAATAADASCELTMDGDHVAAASFTGGRAVARQTYGGVGPQWLGRVAVAPGGDIVVVGSFDDALASPGGDAQVAYGLRDCFVARLSPDASEQRWVTRTRGGGAESCGELAVDGEGNAYVAGYFSGQLELGAHQASTDDGPSHGWMARVDADGSVAWFQDLGTHGIEALLVTDDGALYAAGDRLYTVDRGDGSWEARSLGVAGWRNVVALAPAPDGDLYVAGQMQGDLDDIAVHDDFTAFVARISTSAAIAWARAIDGPGNVTWVRGVTSLADGGAVIAGYFASTITFPGRDTPTTASGPTDWFVVAFGAEGTARWSRTGGGPGRDYATAIATSASGQLYVTGTFEGTAGNPGTTATSAGGYDGWLVRLGPDGTDASFVKLFQSSGSETMAGLAIARDRVVVSGTFGGPSTLGFPSGTELMTPDTDDGFVYVGGL